MSLILYGLIGFCVSWACVDINRRIKLLKESEAKTQLTKVRRNYDER